MKALTVRQPWAAMICAGHKRIEVRSWRTAHRGPLLLHAAARPEPAYADECRAAGFPLGAVVAVVEVVGCRPLEVADLEAAGFVAGGATAKEVAGLWAWELAGVREVWPVACRGRLSLWEAPAEVVAAVMTATDEEAS